MTDTFPCREHGHFDCAAFEGGPCQAEKYARLAMLEAHESHERYELDCVECQRILEEERPQGLVVGPIEVDWPEDIFDHAQVDELARDRADWIRMEDR